MLPYFAERVAACDRASGKAEQRRPVLAIARRVLGKWEETVEHRSYSRPERTRTAPRCARCWRGWATRACWSVSSAGSSRAASTASETGALVSAVVAGLEPPVAGQILGALARTKMGEVPGAVAGLLGRLRQEVGEVPDARWRKALTEIASAIVAALPSLQPPKPTAVSAGGGAPSRITHLLQSIARIKQEYGVNQEDEEDNDGTRSVPAPGTVEPAFVTELLTSLRALGADALHAKAVAAIAADPAAFDPVTVVVPVLTTLHPAPHPDESTMNADLARLWRHAAEFLLARSEQPPARLPTGRSRSPWFAATRMTASCRRLPATQRGGNNASASRRSAVSICIKSSSNSAWT